MSAGMKERGILLVRSKLRDNPQFTQEKYHNWTKLHFKDLLDVRAANGENPDKAIITHTLRFEATNYKQEEYPYINTIHLEDISALHEPPYLNAPRQTDIENTRPLTKNEDPVKTPGNIHDYVDAKFAVLREIGIRERSYQHLPLLPNPTPTTSTTTIYTNQATPSNNSQPSLLISLTSASSSTLHTAHSILTSNHYLSPNSLHTSYYQYAPDAQPPGHPFISEVEMMGGHVILAFVDGFDMQNLASMMDAWVKGIGDLGEEVRYGVWKGEILMGVGVGEEGD